MKKIKNKKKSSINLSGLHIDIKTDFYDKHHLMRLFFSKLLYHFQVNVPFKYPLKTSDNLWFSDVLREHEKETLTWTELIQTKQRLNKNVSLEKKLSDCFM